MSKQKVVVFTPEGARVLTNPVPEAYIGRLHVIDPNLDEVLEVPQHEWHLTEDYKIVKKLEGQVCVAECFLPKKALADIVSVEQVVEKIEEVEVKKNNSKIVLLVGIGLALLTLCAIIKGVL